MTNQTALTDEALNEMGINVTYKTVKFYAKELQNFQENILILLFEKDNKDIKAEFLYETLKITENTILSVLDSMIVSIKDNTNVRVFEYIKSELRKKLLTNINDIIDGKLPKNKSSYKEML